MASAYILSVSTVALQVSVQLLFVVSCLVTSSFCLTGSRSIAHSVLLVGPETVAVTSMSTVYIAQCCSTVTYVR